MQVLYDTRTVHALDRYDYYRARSANEFAPVSVHGRAPGRLFAAMSVARIGEAEVADVSWSADSELMTLRTDRWIRACDPECYRVFLNVRGVMRGEQADNRVEFRTLDMALYDLSQPLRAIHGTHREPLRAVMLSFPRTWVPVARTAVQPLLGTVMPKSLRERDPIAQFLIGLADIMHLTTADPGRADLVRECLVGLIRRRLGRSGGASPHACRLLQRENVHNIIRRDHGNSRLNLSRIAEAANMSLRSLHKLFRGAELTPMRQLKRIRLEECDRSLRDPALAASSMIDIIARHGYRRSDQFTRDYKQLYGISPSQIRK